MGIKGSGRGSVGGVEGQLPSPPGIRNRRRREGLSSTCGLLETEGSGLCGRSLEPASAGNAYPRARGGGRLSCVVAGGQSDRVISRNWNARTLSGGPVIVVEQSAEA